MIRCNKTDCIYRENYPTVNCLMCNDAHRNYQPEQKITNSNRIRILTDRELAIEMLNPTYYKKSAFSNPLWCTSNGKEFSNFEEAVTEQVSWLNKESDSDETV